MVKLTLVSYFQDDEINHYFSIQSCEKELEIFELKRIELLRIDSEKDLLMASVSHD